MARVKLDLTDKELDRLMELEPTKSFKEIVAELLREHLALLDNMEVDSYENTTGRTEKSR